MISAFNFFFSTCKINLHNCFNWHISSHIFDGNRSLKTIDMTNVTEINESFNKIKKPFTKRKYCIVNEKAFHNCSVKAIKLNQTHYKLFNFITNCDKIEQYEINSNIKLYLQKVGSSYKVSNLNYKEPELMPVVSSNNNQINIKYIGPFCVIDCSKLTKIFISNDIGIKSIPKKCFAWTFLKEITIPDPITRIGSNAFYSCNELEKVIISNASQIEVIKMGAFNGCYKLKSINLPSKIKIIPKNFVYRSN